MENAQDNRKVDSDVVALGPRINRTMIRFQTFVISRIVDVLVVLVLLILIWVVGGLAVNVWRAISTGAMDVFKTLTTELLTVFVFVELFRSLSEYERFGRIRITHLTDASLAFVLREIWIALYSGGAHWQELLAMAVLIASLGAVRTLAVIHSPSDESSENLGATK